MMGDGKIIKGAMRIAIVIFSFAFVLSCDSCPRKKVGGPVDILPGETCSECGMHITDVKFAGEYVTSDGRVKKFDDLGCLVESYIKEKDKVVNIWVKDFDTGVWIGSDEAVFVEGFTTPMNYGFVAFRRGKRDGLSFEEFVNKIKGMIRE